MSGPTRPINIVIIMINSLNGLISGVIPVDNPTVPKADTTSKSSCINVYSGSKIHSRNVEKNTRPDAKNVSINAFVITSFGIFLLKLVQC